MVYEIDGKPNAMQIIQIIWNILRQSPKLIYLILQFFKLLEKLKMDNNKKTNITATVKVILGMIALILGLFGKSLPPEVQEAVVSIAGLGYLVFSWIQGLLTNKPETKPE